MHLKIHTQPGESTITALCDDELIGQTISDAYCDFCISDDFFGTEPAGLAEIESALVSAVNANIVGRKSCATAIRLGVIAEEDCRTMNGVPYAQIYRL